MEFKSIVTFRWMSGIPSNFFPFKASFSRGNRKKSGRLRSSENSGFKKDKLGTYYKDNCVESPQTVSSVSCLCRGSVSYRWWGVVVRRGVPAQVSSSSPGRGDEESYV
ncbi:hypothetical protein TNCV_2996901 [Trichonephila clavipes]|nr:hypothetical protein TNCV_2996901 [Trichonephila clavipes]